MVMCPLTFWSIDLWAFLVDFLPTWNFRSFLFFLVWANRNSNKRKIQPSGVFTLGSSGLDYWFSGADFLEIGFIKREDAQFSFPDP